MKYKKLKQFGAKYRTLKTQSFHFQGLKLLQKLHNVLHNHILIKTFDLWIMFICFATFIVICSSIFFFSFENLRKFQKLFKLIEIRHKVRIGSSLEVIVGHGERNCSKTHTNSRTSATVKEKKEYGHAPVSSAGACPHKTRPHVSTIISSIVNNQ